MDYNQLPREPLGFFPTPLIELKRLSKVLGGPKIYMKRDDNTGLALGGNKTRKLEFIIGDAKEEIKKLDKIWDLIFIDADKESYLEYLKLIKPNLRSGSIILIDNVLWYGKVLQENPKDKSTEQIKLVNKIVAEDPDFENLILPLRDGLHLIRKK